MYGLAMRIKVVYDFVWTDRVKKNMKSELDSIREWYEYNSFVRKKYLRLIFSEKVPEAERYRNRGASYPSIVDIFVHVLDAYRWWFVYVYNNRTSDATTMSEQKKYTELEVVDDERKIDSLVIDIVRSMTPTDLERVLSVHEAPDQTWSIKLREILMHMVEEGLQHRGEMNALLWQINVEPPITELQDYLRQR